MRTHTSWRQKLHAFTGDREQEGHALASTVTELVAEGDVPSEAGAVTVDAAEVEAAAHRAVADAHGDSGVSADDESTPDLAEPADVAESLASERRHQG